MSGVNKFLKSFYYASQGIVFGALQRNFRIHIAITILVLILGLFLNLSSGEWLVVIIMSGLVLSAELFNTAIEEISNLLNKKLKLEYYDTWNIRNLGAAGVFVLAITAFIIGIIIFLPKIITILQEATTL